MSRSTTFDATGLRIESTVGPADARTVCGVSRCLRTTPAARSWRQHERSLDRRCDRIAADLRQVRPARLHATKAADDKYPDDRGEGEGRRTDDSSPGRAIAPAAMTGPASSAPPKCPPCYCSTCQRMQTRFPCSSATLRMPEPDAPGKTALVARVPLDAVTFAVTRAVVAANRTAHGARACREQEGRRRPLRRPDLRPDRAAAGQRDAGEAASCSTPRLPSLRTPVSRDCGARRGWPERQRAHGIARRVGRRRQAVLRVGDLIIATRMRPRQAEASTPTQTVSPSVTSTCFQIWVSPLRQGPLVVAAFQAVADHSRGALEASLDLKRDGAIVTSLPLRLPEPEDDGLLRFATRFRLEVYSLVCYVLAFTVRQDKASVERTACLTIRGTSERCRPVAASKLGRVPEPWPERGMRQKIVPIEAAARSSRRVGRMPR